MKKSIIDRSEKLPGENRITSQTKLLAIKARIAHQQSWQRIILLIVLCYEGAGALVGGILLVLEPNGRLMDMQVDIMHGFFHDFLIPGTILISLGILNSFAFIAILRRTRFDWLLSSLGLGGLAIWFIVEIIILQELHWLHAMWGLPVLVGCLVIIPLVYYHLAVPYQLKEG